MSDTTQPTSTPSPQPSPGFDYRGALAAGYSPKEIADHLASDPTNSPIDIAGARAADGRIKTSLAMVPRAMAILTTSTEP